MPQWDYAAESYAHNPDSALLNLAEATAFGGGAGCDNQLRSSYGLYDGSTLLTGAAVDIRDMEMQNQSMFESLRDLTDGLASRGILWDVLTENRCNKKSFSRLRVLIYQDVERISEAEADAVLDFLGKGGLVIAAGIVGDLDDWFAMRLSGSMPGAAAGRSPSHWRPRSTQPSSPARRCHEHSVPARSGLGKAPLTAGRKVKHSFRDATSSVVRSVVTLFGIAGRSTAKDALDKIRIALSLISRGTLFSPCPLRNPNSTLTQRGIGEDAPQMHTP
jgi:hypothetical protein